MKEQTIEHSPLRIDDIDSQRRRKRPMRDDDHFRADDITFHFQKKRSLGPLQGNRPYPSRQNSDDQDDETLIRETQAALKSLSGSWPDSRGSLYQDENPSFQNLFEIQNNARKMSPTVSAAASQSFADFGDYAFRETFFLKNKADLKNHQKLRRDKDELSGKCRPDASKNHLQYPSHDFNELVEDSSNELQIDMNVNGIQIQKDDDKCKEMCRNNDYYPTYPGHRNVPFSQSSAFRPPTDIKRGASLGMPLGNPYLSADPGYSLYGADVPVPGVPNDTAADHVRKSGQIRDDDMAKPLDSPDSKQYIILQPAGVGSKAASVMQDIARDGVVSVAAVSSTSSPGLNAPFTATVVDKLAYERPMPPFSPGNSTKGNFQPMISKPFLMHSKHTNNHRFSGYHLPFCRCFAGLPFAIYRLIFIIQNWQPIFVKSKIQV